MRSLEVVSVRKAQKISCLENGRGEGSGHRRLWARPRAAECKAFLRGQRRKKKGGRGLGEILDVRKFQV